MQQKSHIIATAGTILFLLLVFLLLWLIYIGAPEREEDEGILVAFGTVEEAGGTYAEEPAAAQPAESVSPPPAPQAPSDNDLMTQEDEESLALAKQREEEEKRKRAEEEELIRKQKEAETAAEAERIAREKQLAEQRAKEQQAIENANKLGSLFGKAESTAQGNGDTQGEGLKGNPVSKGVTPGGDAWSLNGRSLRGNLAKPTAVGVQEGKVVVAIRVNAAGKVISADVGSGTTISEKVTIRAAIEAAQKAKFSEGNGDVIGTITYYFKNN